jgi:cysteine desulfurase/selenocysteine lyase
MTRLLDIEAIRRDFSILDQQVHNKPLIYLDSAATSQKPHSVILAVNNFYEKYNANINRGAYYLSEIATGHFHNARADIASFIGTTSDNIIFTRSSTESINLVAHCLENMDFFNDGDEIILSEMEHHANIVPWWLLAKRRNLKLKVTRVLDNGELDIEHFKSLFTKKSKIAAFTHASNALGTINPVQALINIAKSNNVATLIDGAQAIPHMAVDVAALDVDFYAFSGHKAYGPTGIGVLYAKSPWLQRMPPYQGGGDMITSVSFEDISFAKGPQKFEAGTPHIAGALGLAEACRYMMQHDREALYAYEKTLHDYALKKLASISDLEIIGKAQEKVSLISFVMPKVHAHDLSSIFDRHGIALRAGHLCAEPLVRRFGHSAFARMSLAFYNTKAEIDIFISIFERVREIFKL